MNNILSIILLLFLTGTVCADTFYVGGKELEIPPPQGFSRVTQQMDAVYRLSLQMADPVNDQLAYYIAESDIPVAMSGEIPPLERYYILKVNQKLKDRVVGSKDFAELKSITKRQNKEILKSVESQIPGLLEKTSKGISKEFDVNFALRLSQVVPLDSHYETDNTFSYSMYINYGASTERSKEAFIISATATFVNIAGKILFLYCYGPQKDLEWTRDASKAWTSMVMASNSQPPSRSSGSLSMDWNKVFEKGIIGAIAGGLIALIFGVFSRLKKKKG
jgi:hypothetical protein